MSSSLFTRARKCVETWAKAAVIREKTTSLRSGREPLRDALTEASVLWLGLRGAAI